MSLRLKPVDETSVYISQGGYLVIKQVNGVGEESHIFLSPEYARAVADELYRQTEDTSWWDDGQAEDDDPPSSLASPQAKDVITKMNMDAADRAAEAKGIVMQMNIDKSKGAT